MLKLLLKRFVKNSGDLTDAKVRSAYGTVCGIFGIFLNIVLFSVKFAVGLLSASLAITADAFNNLSDAGASIVTLAGFRLADKKPDPDHPFGHGRMEYISGLIVSFIIILMGFELAKMSVSKLISPTKPDFSLLTVIALVFSILIKLYMSLYNKKYGKLINSSAMKATATDSLSDMLSTLVVLISGVICYFTDFIYLDGICGLLVSLFILLSGYRAAKDTISPLLGQPPSREFIKKLEELTMSNEKILGMHDTVVHDYGPGRIMVSLHAEVSCNENVLVLHDIIDNLEQQISETLGCETVIHLDPIDTEDTRLNEIKETLSEIIKKVSAKAMFHDLKIVPGDTHTNLIFDVLLPPDYKGTSKEAKTIIRELVHEYNPDFNCVIKIDTDYVGVLEN
jgi:cation diffusion facilitator family transporter